MQQEQGLKQCVTVKDYSRLFIGMQQELADLAVLDLDNYSRLFIGMQQERGLGIY